MARYPHPDAFLDIVGQELGVSGWVAIDQARIDAFAEVTNDHQWLHVDPARAASDMPGGKTIAHGFLVLSLIPGLSYEFFEVDNLAHTINYGLNKVRFTAMVPVDSRVRLRQTLKSAEKRDDGAVHIVLDSVIELEGSERPAAIAETVRLMYPQPIGKASSQ
ncbi:MAG: MaoC family dehydratase [Alphaproteobacteria bacterium]|nr:MaoC family dehydratase [Alphaproteobacteria bacterium]